MSDQTVEQQKEELATLLEFDTWYEAHYNVDPKTLKKHTRAFALYERTKEMYGIAETMTQDLMEHIQGVKHVMKELQNSAYLTTIAPTLPLMKEQAELVFDAIDTVVSEVYLED